MKGMKIEKAEKLGLCFGVRRAIKLLKEAVNQYGEIETLGPLAHNRLLVESLASLGVRPINDLKEVKGKVLAITTHGASPTLLAEIASKQIHVIDTTCPIVRKAQNTARELAEAGFDVIIFGEGNHSEVKGLLGHTGGKGLAVLNTEQVEAWVNRPSRLGIISQTTQTRPAFIEFAGRLISVFGPGTSEMRFVNTLCQVTQGQQDAAMRLAHRTQLMIVIGGSNSANASHLVAICSPIVETHLVETADEIDGSWLSAKQHIGITAGASTPDEAVEDLIDRLRSLGTSA